MSILTLDELQKKFVMSLNEKSNAIFEWIDSSETLSAEEHFAIYKHSIAGALQIALKEIYTVCHKLVGNDFFIFMINHYILHNKSYSPTLAGYGGNFPLFIENFDAAKSLPYLADVARLEWAWHLIFSAAPSKGIDFLKLSECYVHVGEQLIFNLPQASTLLSSRYPIHLIWEANQDDNDNNEGQIITLPDDTHFYYLVWRKELAMRIDLITEVEWQILSWIQKGLTWGGIYKEVSLNLPIVNLEEMLPKWVKKGWITEFKIRGTVCG
jgi:Putative DNA-binding domain